MEYIFITGIFRSGTTLLSRMLSAHYDIHVFYQPFTYLFNYTMNQFWKNTAGLQPKVMGDPLLIEKFHKEFVDNVLIIPFNDQEMKSIKRGVSKDFAIDSPERNMDALSAFDNASGVTFFELLQSALENLRYVTSEGKCAILGIKEIWCETLSLRFLSKKIGKLNAFMF